MPPPPTCPLCGWRPTADPPGRCPVCGGGMGKAVYVLRIEAWHPTKLNDLMGHWRKRARLKKADREMVAHYAFGSGIPAAKGKRRVSLTLTLAPRQRAGDPDAYQKSLFDALVWAGLIVDDNRQGVELGRVEFERGKERATEITLEELE